MAKKELETVSVSIDEITPHPKNVRQGDIGAISESLKAHGQYRAIVVQRSTGHILAGNHTWKAAKALGWKNISAHFIDCDDDQGLRILLADNRANDLATYDDAALAQLLKELAATDDGLTASLYDGDALDQIISDIATVQENESIYTQKVTVPHYEIVGEKPEITQLFDRTKTDTLIEEIDSSDIPDDIKEYLRLAAHRHVVFDYQKAAEFYAHCTPEIQKLFERSVLVIIDAETAIAEGYARFALRLDELMKADDDAS
jgi:hypothetical protein